MIGRFVLGTHVIPVHFTNKTNKKQSNINNQIKMSRQNVEEKLYENVKQNAKSQSAIIEHLAKMSMQEANLATESE